MKRSPVGPSRADSGKAALPGENGKRPHFPAARDWQTAAAEDPKKMIMGGPWGNQELGSSNKAQTTTGIYVGEDFLN